MISDADRREVARKLREDPERVGVDYVTDGELLDIIAADVGIGVCSDGFDVKLMDRLADLIDRPTCHKVIPSEMEGYVFCSRCGAKIGEYGVPNYCHNCGAELVE